MFRLKTLVVLCGAALCACAPMDRTARLEPQVTPVDSISHGGTIGDPDYQIGRYQAGRLRYDEAIAAWRRAVAADPGNAEAHNALGTAYAGAGNFTAAEAELRAALTLAPDAAHVHNNLGYLCLLRGSYADALPWFKRALELDPGNVRARDNLRLAEARMGRADADPQTSEAKPLAPLAHDESAQRAALADRQSGQLRMLAPNVFELAAAPSPPSRPVATAVRSGSGLEVANGNGTNGLARQTADYLHAQGYAPARLTNQRPFVQTTTQIQYRGGHEAQARQLGQSLPLPITLVESRQLDPRIALRVVLGRDFAPRLLAASAQRPPVVVASIGLAPAAGPAGGPQ